MKKRILHLIDSLGRSGAARQMALLVEGLDRDGYDHHVCALAAGGPAEDELRRSGATVTVLGRRWLFDPQAAWKLRRYIAASDPDVLHAWDPVAGGYAVTVAKTCAVLGLVLSQRSPRVGATALNRRLAQAAGAVVVNSETVRKRCLSAGWPADRLRLIPNGVAPAGPSPLARSQLLAALGIPKEGRLIGFAGPLTRQKQGKDAIWAADLLKVFRDDVHLAIFGDGPAAGPLRKYRDHVRITDKVHFLGDRGDLRNWMPHFDLFWSTSRAESFSNVILEAMSAGVPVVASDVLGTREIIVHDETGFLVPVGDRAGYARWAERLLNDASLADRIGAAGRARILVAFGVDKMVAGYAALYRTLPDTLR